MNNSESARKINQAVSTTGKAVGGAISQAKGALNSWWSSMTTQVPVTNNLPLPQQVNNESNSNGDNKTTTYGIDGDAVVTTDDNNQSKIVNVECENIVVGTLNTAEMSKNEINLKQPYEGIIEIGHEAVDILKEDTNRRVNV